MSKHEITPEQLLEVIEARKINTDPQIDKRLYGLQLRGEGIMNTEIAKKLNVTPFVVCRWLRRATEHGVQSFLAVKPNKQTPLGITSEQRLEIINTLKNSRNPNIDNRLIAILLRCEGMRDVEIAKKFGVSETSVRLWISKYRKYGVKPLLTITGFEPKPFEITLQERLEITMALKNNTNPKIERYLHAILLRSDGMSNAEIAQKFNVSLPCVYKWVNKFKKSGVHPYITPQRNYCVY
jgi:transposase